MAGQEAVWGWKGVRIEGTVKLKITRTSTPCPRAACITHASAVNTGVSQSLEAQMWGNFPCQAASPRHRSLVALTAASKRVSVGQRVRLFPPMHPKGL